MSAHCCEHETPVPHQIVNLARYRKVLWIALSVNLAMFVAAGVIPLCSVKQGTHTSLNLILLPFPPSHITQP